MTNITAASKATDRAFSDSVRTAIWTDMAPSWAKVVTSATTGHDCGGQEGEEHGDPFGLVVGTKKSALDG